MTVTASPIDVDTLIPDGIEPVEAFRCWTLEGGELKSLNGGGVGQAWTPGEPLVAKCNANPERYRWSVERGGMTHEQACKHASFHNQQQQYLSMTGSIYFLNTARPVHSHMPSPPKVELPVGYGFVTETETHEAPDENCTCGIYAASSLAGVPSSGNVYGKVNLWGKVVPGEKGYRAEFAYPSEFHVSPKLANHPTLLAFGVPISTDAASAMVPLNPGAPQPIWIPSFGQEPRRDRRGLSLGFAIGLNLGAALLNLSLSGWHFV